MKVKDLKHDHPIIFKRCLELLKEDNLSYEPETDTICHISDWELTKEGVRIWGEVDRFNFKPFYEFYKTQKQMNTKLKVGDKVYFTKESAPNFNVPFYLTPNKKYKVLSVDEDMYFKIINDNNLELGTNIVSVGHLKGGTWLIAKPKKKLQKKYDLLKLKLETATELFAESLETIDKLKNDNLYKQLELLHSILKTMGEVTWETELNRVKLNSNINNF